MPTTPAVRSSYATSLEFIPTRAELPLILNARALFGCGVEVGVQRGKYSAQLLSYWRGRHLISIDPWLEQDEYADIANVHQETQNALYQETCRRLARFGERSSIWRMTSVEAARHVPRHSLDFAYLDARHDYASVIEDLEAWYDKLRPGGIIAGHDYLDGDIPEGVFGVKSAVDEFFAARSIPVHATSLDAPWLTWIVAVPLPELEDGTTDAPLPTSTIGARTTVTLSFAVNGAPRQVKLALDPAQASQRLMLDCLAGNQMYEPETCALLTAVLREGDLFVDVGTHVGFFSSIAAALVGERGRVVSFEPEARNFAQIGDHVTINGFSNVTPICAAVGAQECTAELWVNVDNDGGHALWDVGLFEGNEESRAARYRRPVPVMTLDTHLASGPTPRLIKIDVEGSELEVLRGARALLERRVPYVVCEINRMALAHMNTTEDELRRFMTDLGYETNVVHPRTGGIITLRPDQHVEGMEVFNLVFRHMSAPLIGAASQVS